MGYIPPVPFLSHYPFKCSASTEVRAFFFGGAPGQKGGLGGGGGEVFFRPIYEQNIKHENVHCNVLFCVCLLFNYN